MTTAPAEAVDEVLLGLGDDKRNQPTLHDALRSLPWKEMVEGDDRPPLRPRGGARAA